MSNDPNGWRLQFASDNTAGICPEAQAAFNAANVGWAAAYGDDDWTRVVCNRIRQLFDTDCEVFFVFNGTAANSLALAALCQSYHSVICAESSHVETDECGAPEFFSNGTKLLRAAQTHGRLRVDSVAELINRRADVHYPRPRVVTLSQPTEFGTLYTLDQLARISATARQHGLKLHMDGARFANAVAALDMTPADLTWRAGVDVLCFGGTKMGLPLGEAIVFFDRALAHEFAYRCKQAGQLASKMRFLSAPWLAMFDDDTWLRHARQANAMATLLAAQLSLLPGVVLATPTQANGVFAQLPELAVARLRSRGWSFYTFIGNVARFMCSWATTEAAVEALVADVALAVAS